MLRRRRQRGRLVVCSLSVTPAMHVSDSVCGQHAHHLKSEFRRSASFCVESCWLCLPCLPNKFIFSRQFSLADAALQCSGLVQSSREGRTMAIVCVLEQMPSACLVSRRAHGRIFSTRHVIAMSC